MWFGGGAGKTSIARTMYRTVAASFFFKTGDPLRSQADRVIPTSALQTAAANPTWKQVIEEGRLTRDLLLLEHTNKATQLSTLIHRPLHGTHSEGHHRTSMVIVVDALGECDDHYCFS